MQLPHSAAMSYCIKPFHESVTVKLTKRKSYIFVKPVINNCSIMKKVYLGILVLLLLIATYIILLFILSPQNAIYLTIEDGFTETLSVICCFISAVMFFYLFYKSGSRNEKYLFTTNRNYFLFLLGLFCILIIGEEINWGQRMWGLKAPEWILEKESNEMNLHNIDTLFTIAGIRITAGRLFFSFVILYFS